MSCCDGCGSVELREIDGELTCTDCGLVIQERMMQDTINYITYTDQGEYNAAEEDEDVGVKREYIQNKKLGHYQAQTYTNCEKKYIGIKSRVEELQINDGIKKCAIRILKDTIYNGSIDPSFTKCKKLVMLIALSVYYSGMYLRSGVDIRAICSQLDIDWKKVLAISSEIVPFWYNKKWYKGLEMFNHTDKLRRAVHELTLIDQDKERDVKRTAEKLYQRVWHYPKLTSSKNNSVILTCVYISCKVVGVKVAKNKFCQEVNMSVQTLNNHETAIQQVLEQSESALI